MGGIGSRELVYEFHIHIPYTYPIHTYVYNWVYPIVCICVYGICIWDMYMKYAYGIYLHGRSRLPIVHVYICIRIYICVCVWDTYMGYVYGICIWICVWDISTWETSSPTSTCVYMYTYIHIYMCVWGTYMGYVYGYVYGIHLHGRSRLPKVHVYICIHTYIHVGVWDMYMGYVYGM